MHHGTGERTIGAGTQAQRQVGLLHGAVVIDVDRHDLGTALLAGAGGMGHHIDLRVDGIGAPNHDQIGLGHLARIGTGKAAGAGNVTGPGQRRADGGIHARIAFGMAQAIDAVTHDEAHGAGIVIGPHRLRTMATLGRKQGFGHKVEGRIPANALELV